MLTETGNTGRWALTKTTVNAGNGSITAVQTPLVLTDAANSNTTVLSTLNLGINGGGLVPAGDETAGAGTVDAPIDHMLDDAKTEATRLIAADGTNCRNTIVVLVVGGEKGNTSVGTTATKASQFLAISSRRVRIYVIAIAPASLAVTDLTLIATNSGGQSWNHQDDDQ